MASRRNVKYSRLATDEDDDDQLRGRQYDPRFDYTPKALDKVPWKSILLALLLLFLGSLLLFLSFFILTGHMGGERSQGYGLLALGILTFLPGNCQVKNLGIVLTVETNYIRCNDDLDGFYETRIAYYSWRGATGYHFAAIPDY